ncbi:hypothetical protein QJQ45_004486 [Haematococcus lacustris]|nr:hypothetical protein QJQ45_004486 [Haematococcus lacustris]
MQHSSSPTRPDANAAGSSFDSSLPALASELGRGGSKGGVLGMGWVECWRGCRGGGRAEGVSAVWVEAGKGSGVLPGPRPPRGPRGSDQRRGRVVLVDEHRTSRVSSAVNGQQPCEVELNKLSATRPAGWKPPAGQVHHRLVRPAWSQQRDQPAPSSSQAATQPAASEPGPSTPLPAKRNKRTEAEQAAEPSQPTRGKGKAQGKAAKAKPAPQPGRWLDRDCNAALNMQRIGESRWRPLELCYWPEQGKLPAKGTEYPEAPKTQRQHPAAAQCVPLLMLVTKRTARLCHGIS